uniref:hypothetical protein n=3 Tax=Pseudomonas viridiflava TaxID=33069 RepID=UPI00197BA76D
QTIRNLLNEHVFVGGGLPAMQSTRYVRKIASSFIAGKPPPTVLCLLPDSYVEDVAAPPTEKALPSTNRYLL